MSQYLFREAYRNNFYQYCIVKISEYILPRHYLYDPNSQTFWHGTGYGFKKDVPTNYYSKCPLHLLNHLTTYKPPSYVYNNICRDKLYILDLNTRVLSYDSALV